MGEQCFICGDDNQNSLQTHHIVPRRYGGSDHSENLVDLCASCHQSVEKIYDDDFYRRLGVEKPFKDGSIEQEPIDSLDDLDDADIIYVHSVNQFYRCKVTSRESRLRVVKDSSSISFKPIPKITGTVDENTDFPVTYRNETVELVESNDLVKVEVEGPLIETLKRAMEESESSEGTRQS